MSVMEGKCGVWVGTCLERDASEKKASLKDIRRASPCIVSACRSLCCKCTNGKVFPLKKHKVFAF